MGAAESKPTPSPQPTSLDYEGLDFYEILCVSKEATNEEVKQAYYKRAKYTHPDKDSTPGAKERFQKLNEAYETLKSPERRAVYDIELENESEAEAESEPDPDPRRFGATSSMPGQWGTQEPPTRSAGWFDWLFSGWTGPEPSDPLLRYVPSEYIARNQHPEHPKGISAKDIHEYLTLCMRKATWEENGRDPSLYTLLRNLFECIAYDEKKWGYQGPIPDFGCGHSAWCSDDGHAQHYAQEFYTFWLNFETRKVFDWVNPYQTILNDPALLRKIAKENTKVHKAVKEQYNDIIRTIVEMLLPGDPRVVQHLVLRHYKTGELLRADEFHLRFARQCRQKNKGKEKAHTQSNGEHNRTQTKNQRKKQKQRNKAKKKNAW